MRCRGREPSGAAGRALEPVPVAAPPGPRGVRPDHGACARAMGRAPRPSSAVQLTTWPALARRRRACRVRRCSGSRAARTSSSAAVRAVSTSARRRPPSAVRVTRWRRRSWAERRRSTRSSASSSLSSPTRLVRSTCSTSARACWLRPPWSRSTLRATRWRGRISRVASSASVRRRIRRPSCSRSAAVCGAWCRAMVVTVPPGYPRVMIARIRSSWYNWFVQHKRPEDHA